MSGTAPNLKPVALRTPEERYAHVAMRLQERAGISWDVSQVATLEKKIKFVRTRLNQQQPVAPVLPCKIGEDKNGDVHYYRVLIAGSPHTFVWSQLGRCLISYRGPGEITTPINASITTPAPGCRTVFVPGCDPITGQPIGLNTRFRDLSGNDPV